MRIRLNGKEEVVSDGLKVSLLLQELKLEPSRVAVEVNLRVLKKDEYSRVFLKDGDTVEIVTLMGGGYEEIFGNCPYPFHNSGFWTKLYRSGECLLANFTR